MSLATNAALYRAVAKLLTSWGWPVEYAAGWETRTNGSAIRTPSAVTVHHTTTPAYRERTPYTVLTVALDDGVRLLAPLDFDAQAVPPIGARVALHFAPQTDGSLLPLFKTVP